MRKKCLNPVCPQVYFVILVCPKFVTTLPIFVSEMDHLPMNAVTFGLMIPLGRRWKSYSTESTTTVCPALLPPWGKKEKVLIVLDTEDKWRHSTDGINSFHLQLCSFHFAADKRSTWNLPHPGNLLNLVCQTWQFSHEYFHGDFWMVLWFIKVQMLWSTMFLAVLRQTHKHSRMCKHF